MKCEYMVGRTFDTLTQRIVYAYKCTYPEFVPVESKDVSEKSQQQMNAFLSDTISHIYDCPSFLIAKPEPDEYFENGVMNNTNPQLVIKMKNIEKKLFAFYQLLFDIGKLAVLEDNAFSINKAEIKLAGDKVKKLNEVGITVSTAGDRTFLSSERYRDCFPAWKLLTEICDRSNSDKSPELLWFMFMHGIFNIDSISETGIYGDLFSGREYLDKLEKSLLEMGYDYTFKDGRLRLIKEYPEKQLGYLAIEFAWRRKYQISVEFHVPNFTKLLASYDKMDFELQTYVFNRLKNCDGCGYCTQTDKTGKRQPLHLTLKCGSEELLKCPLYPSFNCGDFNAEICEMMTKLFILADKSE